MTSAEVGRATVWGGVCAIAAVCALVLLDSDDTPLADLPPPASQVDPSQAKAYFDGRPDPVGGVVDHHSDYALAPGKLRPLSPEQTPWWQRGPIRRAVSFPVRWLLGRLGRVNPGG